MHSKKAMITGASLAAGVMYFLDPDAGRRRRARMRDQLNHAWRTAVEAMDVTVRDVVNRTRGLGAEARHMIASEKVDDRVLAERVRSELGGVVSHPGSIEVRAENGRVTLSGVILADEVNPLLKRVESVRGVRSVEHRLEVHDEPGNIPGLQGQPARRLSGDQFELMQTYWSPSGRLFAGLAGGSLAMFGMGRRGAYGALASAAGVALFLRALTNMEVRRLIGMGTGRRAIDVQKAIRIHAPVEEVFNLLYNYENFPGLMTHVREVKRIDDRRSHWVVSGPAGMRIEWDSFLTSVIPNKMLAWRSEPGSSVQHAGVVRFHPNPDGSTTVDVKLTYNPLVGGVGHAIATILRADPKTILNEDLLRFKTFVETGIPPHDAARRTRETAEARVS